MSQSDLFASTTAATETARVTVLADGALHLSAFAHACVDDVMAAIAVITAQAPFRRMVTPGGHTMSVAMTNCGAAGWVSDRRGYRYDAVDPQSGALWPAMPEAFRALAVRAAQAGGYDAFVPDVCLINRYEPGARMSLHQDRDERDLEQPIVSVSLGLPAKFLFGGMARTERPRRVMLQHGDVCVWGGAVRLAYHGIDPLKDGDHPITGRCRINLTFRKAL